MREEDLLYFNDNHLWIDVQGDEAVIGITDYAQDQLGEILFVELPEEGDTFDEGDEFSCVESAKSASGLDAPFAFEVLAVNDLLEDEPEAVNESAYESWIVRVRPEDPGAFDSLDSYDSYQRFIGE